MYVELHPAAAAAAQQADAGSWKRRTAAELVAHCRALLPPAAVPAAVVVSLQALPRSPAGKLDRGALMEPKWTESDPGKQAVPMPRHLCLLSEGVACSL